MSEHREFSSADKPSEGTLHFHCGGQALQVFAARDFDCTLRFGGRRLPV
jgi:hypothetical protein